jgi:hypothetical protein
MLQIIQYLVKNRDVLQQVSLGNASLVGVNQQEQETILEVFFKDKDTSPAYFWK